MMRIGIASGLGRAARARLARVNGIPDVPPGSGAAGAGADPETVFAGLAALIYSGSYEGVFGALCTVAPRLVDGCDHASLMLTEDGAFRTAASSDETAATVDDLERRTGEGPCVDAILREEYQLEPDLSEPSEWPVFAARVLAETPVRGVAGFRILDGARRQKAGALNLFSDTPRAFTARAGDQGAILAAFTSVALMSVAQGEEARTLRAGLESNREIGKAVGLLMAAHQVDDDGAFAILRKASQDLNLKVAEIAREVVQNANRR